MNTAVSIDHSVRMYGVGEARLIMEIVNESPYLLDDSPLLEIRDDGVFVSNAYKEAMGCLRGAEGIDELFFWNPAWELEDGPSPLTAPLLPIPFTARNLAALLVGGISCFIRERFGEIGHLDETRLSSFGARDAAHARRALREAYALAAGALASVGPAEAFGESDDDAEQQLTNWRGAMVRELLEGAEGGHEAGRKTGDEQTHQEQAAPAKQHKPRGRRPSGARALLLQILDALESYAAATGQDFDRNAMPGPLGESFDDEGSLHWLCAGLYRDFKKAKPTFQKHRAGLCALAPYAKPTDFYRRALPHIAPKLGVAMNVHHMPKKGHKAS